MALQALLFSRDQGIIDLAGEVLRTLDIEVEQSGVADDAVRRLAAGKFDAILVDNADASGAVAVLSAAQSLASCEKSIGIVLATSPSSIGLAKGARTHMVLYRPLSADRLRTGVKSALGLRSEGEDARESPRSSIRIPATLRGAGLDEALAFITNLSVGGAALYVGQDIPSSSIQSIEFSLPGEKDNLTTAVELIWRDVQGRMGIRFASVSAGFSASLEKWAAAQPEKQRAAKAGA
jgi:PilZ domain